MLHSSSPILVDTENTTDTKAYMGVPITDVENCAVEIVDTYGFVGGFDETYELKAERPAAAVTAEGRYVTVSVSPMGASIAEAGEWAELTLLDYIDRFTITMTDGSEYVVRDWARGGGEPMDNTTYLCGRIDGSAGFCFNRIIDPDAIASVTVKVITGGDADSGYTFAEDTIEF